MNRLLIIAGLAGLLAATSAGAGDSTARVREDFDRLAADGLSTSELEALSRRALGLARQAERRRDFFSAMTLLSELAREAAPAAARGIRSRAIELLSASFQDTRRWAIFVGESFLPDPARIPQDQWDAEVAAYDRLLDELRVGTDDRRVATELLFAKALFRVRLHQSGRWLDEPERRATLRLLEEIARTSGELPRPGAPEETLGQEIEGLLAELRTLYLGAPAPATESVDLEGEPLALADYKGRVVILDFWTTFCAPCLALVPGSLRLLEKYEGRALALVGVNGDSTREMGLATAKRHGMTWPSFWDGPEGPSGPIATAWQVHGWPTVYVLDGEGRIRYRFHGKGSVDEGLEEALRTLLAEL